jgi:hypothetical protein
MSMYVCMHACMCFYIIIFGSEILVCFGHNRYVCMHVYEYVCTLRTVVTHLRTVVTWRMHAA